MFRGLFGSRPTPYLRSELVAASAAGHAVLIGAVLLITRGTSPHAHGWNHASQGIPTLVQVRYLRSIPADRPTPADKPTSGKALNASEKTAKPARRNPVRERDHTDGRLALLRKSFDAIADRVADIHPTVDVADAVRAIDTSDARWTAVADSEFKGGTERLSDAVRPPVPLVKNGIYTPDLVDEPVTQRPGNPKPRYPESLRAAGVEAAVNVEFVVDTTGRVDEPSIKFSSHIHQLFMDAIRVSLHRARFFPARFAGSVVPQLVRQEFRFELRERP